MTLALVVTGGPAPEPEIADLLPDADLVVAADAGVDHCRVLGITPTIVVGDLDSISASGHDWVRAAGASLVEHPVDKDATDLDLALEIASEAADAIVVVDSGLGRLDHAIANQLLLASDRFESTRVAAFVQRGLVTIGRGRTELAGEPGDLVSLLAVGGPAIGVTTSGLHWPLAAATLDPGSSWGVSNEFVDADAAVDVESGVLLITQPERRPLPRVWFDR